MIFLSISKNKSKLSSEDTTIIKYYQKAFEVGQNFNNYYVNVGFTDRINL